MEAGNKDRLLSKLSAQAETLAQLSHQLADVKNIEELITTAARLLARVTSFDGLALVLRYANGSSASWSVSIQRGRTGIPTLETFSAENAPNDVLMWALALRQSMLVSANDELLALPCSAPFYFISEDTESLISTTFDLSQKRRGVLAITSCHKEHFDSVDKAMLRYFGTTLASHLETLLRVDLAEPVHFSKVTSDTRRPTPELLPHPTLIIGPNGLVSMANRAAEVALGRGGSMLRMHSGQLELPGPPDMVRGVRLGLVQREPAHYLFKHTEGTTLVALDPLADQNLLLQIIALPPDANLEIPGKPVSTNAHNDVVNLSRGVAHHFNNIFCGLKMWSQLVNDAAGRVFERDDLDDDVRLTLRDGLSAIADGVNRGEIVVAQLADMGGDKRKTTRSNFFTPRSIVDGALDLITESHPSVADGEVRIFVEGDAAGSVLISGDPYGLRNAFLQLIANGVEATDSEGEVHVEIRHEMPGDVVVVTVTDGGHGIESSLLGDIDAPFFTTRGNTHAGLGLTVARSIVERSGGSIDIEALPLGTRVSVRLPAASHSRSVGPRTTGQGNASQRFTTLVIDDDPIIVQRLSRLLKSWGHNTIKAASGREGVAFSDRLSHLDLVLIDQHLPDMSGASLVKILRVSFPSAHIVLLSEGNVGEDLAHRMLRVGADRVVQKPLRTLDLREMVEQLMLV